MSDETFDWSEASKEVLVKCYIQCRDKKEVLAARSKKIDAVMDGISTELLKRMNAAGETGFRTEAASVKRSKVTKVSCASEAWPQFYRWLLTQAMALKAEGRDPTQAFAYLHKRVSKEPIEAYMEETEGQTPPGINVLPEYTIVVTQLK